MIKDFNAITILIFFVFYYESSIFYLLSVFFKPV